MNKIYKVIFNRNKNRYEIVSELASSRGGKCKVKAGKQIAKLFMTGLLATFLSSVALAADQEVKVKYDETTGTIKIIKTDPDTNAETIVATYAVGGNISSIDPNEGTYPTGTISLGKDSKVLQNNTIAIGTDAHAGDASGSVTQSDGKIAIGNKTVASGDRSIALGNQSTTNKGSYNIVQGNDSIGIGTSTSVFGYSGVSIGRRNIIGVPDPDLVNNRVLTTKSKTPDKKGVDKEAAPGGNSVIVGAYNVAYGSRSSIIGTYSRAMGNNSVAIGSGVQSLTDGAIAIGKGSGYEFEDGSRKKGREKEFYGRDWELPPEYKVLKQVLSTDIAGDEQYKGTGKGIKWENGGILPKYNNYGAGSSDPGGFIVEGKNALGIGTYTQVRGDSAIGLATGEMTADLSEKDKSQYARDMRKIMDMEETLYEAKEALQAGNNGDTAALESAVQAAEKSLAAAKKEFRKNYLSKYSFVEGEGALGVGRQILAQGDRSMAVGDYAKAISSDAIAYGGKTLANGTNSMAMGGNAHVGTTDKSFDNSMAIGSHTNVQAGNAVALGAFSQVTGTNSLALGFGTQSSTDSNNITYNSVSGHDSTLIGSYGNIAGNNSILIGSSGSIANDRVVGLGNNINIAAADPDDQENNTAGSVFLGDHAGYVKDSKRARSLGEVTLVGSEEKKELTESLSSTKGALRDYTKDFIYIYMLENQDDGTKIGAPIAVRSDFAGGDSTVGVVSVGSTYEQKFENIEEIRKYHTKVGSLITVPVEVEVEVMKNGINLGKQSQTRYFAADSTRDAIYADNTLSETDKKKVWDEIQAKTSSSDSTYTVFETRRIQNVAPGLIGLNSTDAINGSQLFATNQMLGNLVGSLKKTFGDNVTITEDGQIKVSGGTLGWIAKAKAADGSNGTVNYQVGKDDKITKDDLEKKGSAIEAADQLVFQAGKNIGLVQTPDTLTISTIDTPSFKSVELRGDEKTVDGKKVTEVTKIDSSGMKVVTETSTPASDGSTTVTEKVSTTVGKDGVSTDGSVKVTNGKDGDQAKEFVTIGKGTDGSGTDKEYGKIGLDGKNGSNATITVDRGTSSLDDTKNIGTDPNRDISKDNPAKMDRITYTTKNKDGKDVITHEVATMDDGLFFSGDSADGKNGNMKNTFGRKLSEEAKIVGGVTTPANLTDNNIGVVSNGSDTLTIKLAKQLTGLDSATYTSPTTKTDDGDATSTMKVDGNGIRFVGDNNAVKTDAPSLTTDGITGGGKQITNIDSGLKNGNTTISISDLKDPNKTATINPILNNAVNVSDLKTIVDAGFKLNTSGQPTDPGATTVKIGDTINVVDGANTKVSAITPENGTHTFHIDVNGLPMSYVDNQGKPLTKIGDTFYRTEELVDGKPPAGAKGVPDTEVTSNVTMLDKNGKNVEAPQIKNVGSGLVNGNNKAMSPSDLLNTADNNPVLKNAVNAGDLKQVAAAVKTEVTGTGKAIVTNTTAQDGHTIYNVHVDPVVNVVAADGKTQVVRGDDGKYYDPADIENKTFVPDGKGGGNWYNTSDIGDNGQPNTGASVQNINPVDVKNNFVNPNGTGSIVVDNVKSGIGGEVKDPAHNNKNTFIDNVNKVGKTTPDGTATQDAISENTVVNAKDLKNLVDTGFKLNTSGQPADPGATTVKIGETIKVVDGTNTKVSAITTSKDGVHAFHIDVTGMPISYTDTDGNALTKIGDNYYKNTDITNGVPNKDAVAVDPEKVTDNIKVINKDGSTTNPGTISNVKSAIDGVVGNGGPNGSTINGEGGTNTFIDNVNRIGADTNGIDKNSVVTTGDLKNLADTPLFFSGDVSSATGTNNTFSRKLSEKVSIVGEVKHGLADTASAEDKANAIRAKLSDGNIGVVSNGTDTLTIKLAKELQDLTSLTTIDETDGTKTIVSGKGVTTDGKVVVNNGKTGNEAKELVTIDKGTDGSGTDKEYGKIGLDGKNGSEAVITIDRGTKSITDEANVGEDPSQPVSGTNKSANMDRITYTTKGDNGNINHEVATLDDGFMLTTSTDIANSKAPANVKLNNTIKFTDGANTKVSTVTSKDGVHELHVDVTGLPMTYTVSQTGGTDAPVSVSKVGDTYQLANGTKLVKVDDKFYKPDQLDTNGQPNADQADKDWKVTNSISLVNPNGEKNAPTLKHVGSGLVDDAGNVTSLADAPDTNAVNVGDLKQVAAAAKTEVTGSGAAEVTKVTGADGQNIYNVHVDKLMTVKPVDANTNIARGGDGKYYNAGDIAGKTFVSDGNGGGSWYNASDVDAKTGKPLTDKTPLDDQPIALEQSKLKNSVVNPNGDGATIVDNVKSGIGGEVKDTSGKNTFIDNINKVGKPASEGGIDKTTVVNAGDLKNLADTPLFFQGDVSSATGTNNTFSRKLSEKVSIVGEVKHGLADTASAEDKANAIRAKLSDGNIGVVSNGTDTLTIKLAKNLVNLTSVETGSGNNKTKMTENGITTTVKDGDTFKVTTTTPNGLATTEVKLDSEGMPKGESTTTMVTTDGVTITTQTPKNGDKPASTTETKLSKDGLATDGTIKVTGDNAKDLVTIAKGTETNPKATDKEFGTVTIDGKNGSNATLTVDRGTKSVTDSANVGKNPTKPIDKDNPAAGMDRLTYTTTGADGKSIINHEVATLDDGFFLTTEHTEADKTRTVLFNNTIKVLDGANTKVSAMGGEDGTHTFSIDVTGLPMTYTATDANGKTQDVHKVGDTYTLADGTKLVQVRDKFYKPDQVEEVNGTPQVKADQEDKDTKLNNISLTSPVANTAPTLSNVGSALKKSDGTRITMSDLDDSSVYPTNNPIWNNAVNVGDLKAATDAARTEVTGTGKAIVTKKTGDQGQNIYNVHVDPIVDVVGADGSKVVRGDDGKYYNPTDIANKTYIPNADGNGGNWYDNGDLTNGVPNQGAKPQNVTPTDVKNNFVNPNGTDSIVLDNVKSGIGGEVKDAAGKNTFIDNINKVGKKNPDGTVAPDAISENTVVNAKDLKNVVDTGFKLNTSGHSGNAQTVKIGETIKVVDGANTKVSAIDDSTTGTYTFHIDVTGLPVTYTATETDGEGKPTGTPVDVTKTKDGYQKADGTPLIKINENGKDVYYTADQLDNNIPKPGAKGLTITDNIRLINPKDGTGATKITNVAAGTDDTDAVNVSQLKQKVAAATTEVTGTGAAEVTKVTGADGQNVYNVHVDKLMEAKSTEPGKTIVRGSDNKYYYVDDALKQANDGKWYPADQVGADGKPADGAVGKDTTELTVVPADKLKNSLVNPNGNGPTIVDNVKSVLDGSGIGNGADMSSKIDTIENGKPVDTAGSNQFIKDLTGLNPTTDADKLNSVSTVSDLQKVALTPLFFEGDTAESAATNNAFGRKLSEKAKIVGGQKDVTTLTDNNIGVVSNGSDTLTVKLAKELTNLTSVTTVDETNGTKTTVSGKGITTDGKVVVNNGKTGDEAKEFVTIDKGTDGSGTDKEYGKIGLDGKNGSNATITIDRGTKSLNDDVNIGVDPSQPVSETNKSATMDRITYTTTGPNKTVINHEVATLDDGFFLTTSKDVTDNKAAAKVKLNNTIKFTDGANTKVSTVESKDGVHELHIDVTGLPMTYTVSQTGGTDAPVSVSKVGDTYQLADGTKLVKVGDKFYKPSQLVNPKADQPEVKPDEVAKDWSVNDSVSLVNKDGSTNAPTLKNVGSGLKDANGNDTTLEQAVGSNAVNVDDLRTMGKAATTEVTGTGAAEVTKVTGANGQNIYNVHVERFMQVAETDVEGNKVVKAADNHYYKEADIKDKTYIDGQWYNNTDIKDKTKIGDKWYNADDVVNGVPEPNATELTVQATTAPNKAVGLQNNLVNPNDNKPTRLSNLASALSGEVGNGANPADNSAINGIDKNGKPTSESGSNTFVKNVLDLDATEKTVEQLKTSLGHEPSEDEVKAEKARAEKDKALLNSAVTVADLQKTLQSPLFFEGDSADGVANENGSDKNTFARKLSQKTKIVGGVDLGLKENATAEERKKAIAEKLTDHNIGVISNGTDTLTIKLAKDLTDLHSVTTTDDKGNTTQINGKGLATTADDGKGNIKITTVTSDGITIVTTDKDGNNSVSLTNKGLDNGHHQIINVKSGLLDRQGKPVTLKNASEDILNNAVNVRDLRDVVQGLTDSGKGGGFGLTGNNGEVHKSLGETITLKGGIANKIENGIDMNKPEKATTDKNTYIDVKTSKNGSEKIMVVEIAKDLTDLNSAEFTDQEGNTTKMKGDGIYIDKNGDGNADISLTSEGLNNGGNKITNVADGTEDTDAVNVSQLNKLKQEIKQNIGDEINELNAYAPVVYLDKEGNRVIRKGNKFVKKNDETAEIPPQDIRLSLVNADGKTTTPSTLQNVAKGVKDTDAVNVKQLTDATEKPLTFNGDAGSSSAKLGETVAIKGGANSADLTDNNIGVIANSSTKTLNVKLSKKLKGLESAEFVDNNGNTTNITGDGVHISGGNGSNVSLTSQGLNNGGNRITNVAPGVEATDAVNVSQLNQVGAALHNRINNVAKGAYGGVASAGAMASLPQAYLPGKSMVAAGASHYRGESAVALGASRISDNGKIILKLNASHNTSGNTMVGAGVGYQF